jgi:hypothetical protein
VECGAIVVSEQWLQGCAKEGKRLDEKDYVLSSDTLAKVWLWMPAFLGWSFFSPRSPLSRVALFLVFGVSTCNDHGTILFMETLRGVPKYARAPEFFSFPPSRQQTSAERVLRV